MYVQSLDCCYTFKMKSPRKTAREHCVQLRSLKENGDEDPAIPDCRIIDGKTTSV